jgi:phosphopantothenoylcysteine decarboxylase/phosphopantothenate--cysteine ligase
VRLAGRSVLVGLSGGIACYKACEVVRLLVGAGAKVSVIMTRGAREFVTPLTLQTLAGHPVATETFDLMQESQIGHIRLADEAEVVVVAPATANVLAKLATGIADDLLTTVLLATRAPLVLAPAMNVHMWNHVSVQGNVARLRDRGARVVGPTSGALACGYEGMGRLAPPEDIVEEAHAALAPQDLLGEHVLVSAGPTHEPLDPARYLSNRSSGKMGYAVARAARRRGATVTLVSGPTALACPGGVDLVAVENAREMGRAMAERFRQASVVVMAAAVADYRPRHPLARKMKKGAAFCSLELARNPDILAGLGRRKRGQVLVGFAAETHDLLHEAERKLRAKHLDLVVANDVTEPGAGFGADENVVHFVDPRGRREALPRLPKDEVAERILDWIVTNHPRRDRGAPRAAPGPVAGMRKLGPKSRRA